MTLPEWFAATSGATALLVSLCALARILIVHGADRRRLDEICDWREKKSIDRFEFVDLCKRVDGTEADAKAANSGLTDLKVRFAEIPGRLEGIRQLMERDNREFRHDISGMEMGLEKLTDLVRTAR